LFERKSQLPTIEPRIPTILAEMDCSILVPNVESYQSRPPGQFLSIFVLFLFIKNVFFFLSCRLLFFLLYKCRFQVILGYSSVFFRYLSYLMLICLYFGGLKATNSRVILKEKTSFDPLKKLYG